jgi:hypothetical protein
MYLNCRNINEDRLAGINPGFGLQTMLYCPNPYPEARAYADLCVDMVKVKLDSFPANENFMSNFFIRFPRDNQLKDFQFTRGEII